MARNTAFRPEREPFQNEDSLQLNSDRVHGPFSFLNPTQAHYDHVATRKTTADHTNAAADQDSNASAPTDQTPRPSDTIQASNVAYKWTSRNNRKGRHAIVVTPATTNDAQYSTPRPTNSFRGVLEGIKRMVICYPIWDVSFLVAYVFTWGSVIWVINAFFAFLPFLQPSTEFSGETTYGGGITAFIGATVFEIGSILLMLEAVNENQTGCFGWAVEKAYDENFGHDGETANFVPGKGECGHHHGNTKNLVGKGTAQALTASENKSTATDSTSTTSPSRSWVWCPSRNELRTHYFHDLGFLACCSQMFGASVFWISGTTALPGIFNYLTTPAKLNGAYWAPQIIGGLGFVVSGTLFMVETQKHWWKPAPTVLGWHIGMWNLIGGIGFTVCPIFGLYTAHWGAYQASCSTFWGSWAFLIGSCIQWYESLEKYPVREQAPQKQGEMD